MKLDLLFITNITQHIDTKLHYITKRPNNQCCYFKQRPHAVNASNRFQKNQDFEEPDFEVLKTKLQRCVTDLGRIKNSPFSWNVINFKLLIDHNYAYPFEIVLLYLL